MDKVHYVRLFADSAGESHFADEQMVLAPVSYAPPAPPLDLSAFTRATRVGFLGMPEG